MKNMSVFLLQTNANIFEANTLKDDVAIII